MGISPFRRPHPPARDMEGRAAQRSGGSTVPTASGAPPSRRCLPLPTPSQPQGSARPKPSEMNWLRSRPDTSWISAGPASSFPNLGEDADSLIRPRLCDAQLTPGCKIFHVPKDQPSQASEMHVSPESLESPVVGDELKDQVLVFQYRGNFHAVDHVSFSPIQTPFFFTTKNVAG